MASGDIFSLDNASGTELFAIDGSGNVQAAGTMTVDGATTLTGALTAAAITADSLTMTAGVAGTITLVTDGAAEDFTISLTGATDSSLVLSSTGTAQDALQVTASAGGIELDSQGATHAIYATLGTDTAATEFAIRNNTETRIWLMTAAAILTQTTVLGTAAGTASTITVTSADADGAMTGLAVTASQITNVRTSTRVAGVKSTVTSLTGDTASVDYAAFEAGATVGEANADHSVLYSEDAFDFLVKALASGDGGLTVSADGMTADPETATEAGYVSVDIAGTGYQIPIYAA